MGSNKCEHLAAPSKSPQLARAGGDLGSSVSQFFQAGRLVRHNLAGVGVAGTRRPAVCHLALTLYFADR